MSLQSFALSPIVPHNVKFFPRVLGKKSLFYFPNDSLQPLSTVKLGGFRSGDSADLTPHLVGITTKAA